MIPILISKDVFEPSYNDLKFMAWNHNYICTYLVERVFGFFKFFHRTTILFW